jgi:transcriptional regulator with XRE-family HTH domain
MTELRLNDDFYQKLGALVRRRRQEVELGLNQFAKYAKIDPAQLSRFERGKQHLGPNTLKNVLDYLKIELIVETAEDHEKRVSTFTCKYCLGRNDILKS